MKCSNCGNEVDPNSAYCPVCGTKVGEEPTPNPVEPAQEPVVDNGYVEPAQEPIVEEPIQQQPVQEDRQYFQGAQDRGGIFSFPRPYRCRL